MKKPGMMRSFFIGFGAPFRAWALVKKHPRLLGYLIVPFVLNVGLMAGIGYLAFVVGYPAAMAMLAGSDAWYLALLRWIMAPLLFILFSLISLLLYSVTGGFLAAPFNDPLSAAVEVILRGGESIRGLPSVGIITVIGRSLIFIGRLLSLMILFHGAILFLHLVPVIGSLCYSVIGFLGTAFFLAFQCFDFPLERRLFDFRKKLRFVWGMRWFAIGLGTGFMLNAIIPLFGFLAVNLGAIAATMIYLDYGNREVNTNKG